jgi:hypothetical protein
MESAFHHFCIRERVVFGGDMELCGVSSSAVALRKIIRERREVALQDCLL